MSADPFFHVWRAIGRKREDGFDARIFPGRPAARETENGIAAERVSREADAIGIHGNAFKRIAFQDGIEQHFHVFLGDRGKWKRSRDWLCRKALRDGRKRAKRNRARNRSRPSL